MNGAIGDIANWTVGGFYFHANAVQGGRINLDGATDNIIPFAVTTDFIFSDPVKIESKSGFAHVEVRPLDRLTMTGGVRFTDDYKRYDFVELCRRATRRACGRLSCRDEWRWRCI